MCCLPCVFFFFLQAADLSKPIDKRIYKGTQPTCHDFNHLTATAESVSLLVGFSAGQVQLIDPIKKETSKLFNEEVSSPHLSCWSLGRVSLFLLKGGGLILHVELSRFFSCLYLVSSKSKCWRSVSWICFFLEVIVLCICAENDQLSIQIL